MPRTFDNDVEQQIAALDKLSELDGEELLNYAMIHADTPRHLFHYEHVNRILKMGGSDLRLSGKTEFVAYDLRMIEPLIERARMKLKEGSPNEIK